MKDRMSQRFSTLLLLLLGACTASEAGEPRATADSLPIASSPVTVDSVTSIEEALRRFRADLTQHPTRLAGGADSRDQLVERFVRAVEGHDTATIRDLVISRAEFAYLYYPFTPYSGGPMELEPGLAWFLTQQNSEKGITRVLRRLGGTPLGYTGYRCDPTPDRQEQNLLWRNCELQLSTTPTDLPAQRLFGTILERDGRFKLVSYANDL